jgi:flagellin-like protein
MFRSFLRDKRGISEVVGSLIVLLIVSVAGAAVYSYSLNAFSSSTSSFLLQIRGSEERARERLAITAVWWNATNDCMNVTVLNYGKIEFAVDGVYIDGTRVSVYAGGKGETVAKGSLVHVKFTSPVPIVDGQTYQIIVATERGSRDVVYWKA